MKVVLIAALSLFAVVNAQAATSNGNDFALALVEAKTPAAKKAILDDAQGRPHFFRYLQIMEMQEVTEEGRASVKITAFEPASYLDVKFTVTMPQSLALLRDEPVSKVGDAIAVTGRLTGIEPGKNSILLESPIVRQKDRLHRLPCMISESLRWALVNRTGAVSALQNAACSSRLKESTLRSVSARSRRALERTVERT